MKGPSSRFWLWHVPAAVGALATLVFVGAFWFALQGSVGEPIGDPPPLPAARSAALKREGQKLLMVVGDSLARGTGDETGRGFATDVLDSLKKRGPVEIASLAVNGAESADVQALVESANVRAIAASADVILLSVGANDLSHAAPNAGQRAPVAALEDLRNARSRFGANLRAILQTLRDANPTAPIYLLGLYDPFGAPEPPGEGGGSGGSQGLPLRVAASVILQWNALMEETALAFSSVFVVPTFDLFRHRADRLALDRFHPNRRGYAAIAKRIEQVFPDGL